MRWHFPRVGGRGLRNCGNTCFLNAAIQCLGAIDEVNHAQPSTNETTTTQEKLMNCIRELQQPGTAYVPNPLIQQIPHLICYTKGEPADAHELLIAMINDISTPILQIFQTVTVSQLPRPTPRTSPYMSMKIPTPRWGRDCSNSSNQRHSRAITYTGVTHVFDPAGQRKHSPTLTFPPF